MVIKVTGNRAGNPGTGEFATASRIVLDGFPGTEPRALVALFRPCLESSWHPTAVFRIVDPADGGRHKWSSRAGSGVMCRYGYLNCFAYLS